MELCEATEENPFVHGMSRSFVNALQQLFNVLDNNQSGVIRYLDLANMWEEDTADPFLPKGLMICLSKVAMPNGLLTFDRFCAGVKLCLLKNQVEANLENGENTVTNMPGMNERPPSEPPMFAPPPPTSGTTNMTSYSNSTSDDINNNESLSSSTQATSSSATLTFFNQNKSHISGNGTLSSSISSSSPGEDASQSKLPKKLPLPSYEQVMASKSKAVNVPPFSNPPPPPPKHGENVNGIKLKQSVNGLQVKPINQRMPVTSVPLSFYENFTTLTKENAALFLLPEHYRAKSMSNLDNIPYNQAIQLHQNLQSNPELTTVSNSNEINVVAGSPKQSASATNSPPKGTPRTLSRNCIMKTLQNWRDQIMSGTSINGNRIAGDLGELVVKDVPVLEPISKGNLSVVDITNVQNIASLRRAVPKRREPRRHTVGADGVDLYTMKRFQQLIQEKEIIHRGLNEIEKTKEWYLRQMSIIQEKINVAGRCDMFPNDCNIDSQQERINFQAARIQYLNQHLIAIREAAFNYPLHMNLAIRPINAVPKSDPNQPRQLVVNPNLVNKLKEQNRLLTDEVGQKSDRITQLEREKSALIRELFQARTYSSYYNGEFDDTFM